jgi:hypothetical protein
MANETIARLWTFLAPFAKRWDSKYDNGVIPDDDNSFLDELRHEDPESEGFELLVRPYEEDTISPDQEAIIQLCRDTSVRDLDQQDQESVWLDDRTYAAYFPDAATSAHLEGTQNDGRAPTSYQDHFDGRVSNYQGMEPVVHSSPMIAGQSPPDSTFARYSRISRRYLGPLTAKRLYLELKKKVIIYIPSRSFDTGFGEVRFHSMFDLLALFDQ